MNQEHVKAVNKVKKYIEDNLQKKITLNMISNVSGYSPWHISRIFKRYSQKSIFEYIRSLRLSKAALVLRDNDSKVLDVALDFIFDSQEGFTRAFSKEFGISPGKYSKKTPPIPLFTPHLMIEEDRKDKNIMSDNTVIFTQVIERVKRKAIIKRAKTATHYFEYCDEVDCDVWGILCSVKEGLFEPMGMWLPTKLIKPNTSLYVQGVEVPFDYKGEIPEGFELIDLEACKMMIFQGPKYDDNDFMEEVGKVMRAIKEYDPTPFGFQWADEDAPRFQYAPLGERGYIEGRPVK